MITNQANVCLDLLASGCDPTLVDRHGDTPLHIACRHGNLLCFSVITQNCRPEHLSGMMGACNYQGEDRKSFLLSETVCEYTEASAVQVLVSGQAAFCLNRCGGVSDPSMTVPCANAAGTSPLLSPHTASLFRSNLQ